MTNLKLFTVILFLSVLSNSAFAMDIMEYEITMGKIEATERNNVTEKSKSLIEQAEKMQNELGINTLDSLGKISALGQMIFVLKMNIEEIDSMEDTRRVMEMNQELEDFLKLHSLN